MINLRFKVVLVFSLVVVFLFGSLMVANAHFGMIIPSDDMVTPGDNKSIGLKIQFIHPMEGDYMDMAKPAQFGVLVQGKKIDLLNWEPAEDCFIIHYTKVIVNALGLEVGWDEEVGLKTEIVPLTRPYGLWTGNVFQGIVKVKGEVVPYAEVEVEYYNQDGKVKWPADSMITQVIKADQNGVFTYAMPRAGWWGFAALNEDEEKIKHDGEEKSVEIGAVLWVKTHDME